MLQSGRWPSANQLEVISVDERKLVKRDSVLFLYIRLCMHSHTL